jgi:hypothetical protein
MDVAAEVISRARLHGGQNPQQQEFLLRALAKFPKEKVVPELLSIFARSVDPESDEAIQQQELAGYLLWYGEHRCPVPLREALLTLLEGWNVSIEEVPWFLAREYGASNVRECIAELAELHGSDRHQRIFKTLDFWVRNYEPADKKL